MYRSTVVTMRVLRGLVGCGTDTNATGRKRVSTRNRFGGMNILEHFLKISVLEISFNRQSPKDRKGTLRNRMRIHTDCTQNVKILSQTGRKQPGRGQAISQCCCHTTHRNLKLSPFHCFEPHSLPSLWTVPALNLSKHGWPRGPDAEKRPCFELCQPWGRST